MVYVQVVIVLLLHTVDSFRNPVSNQPLAEAIPEKETVQVIKVFLCGIVTDQISLYKWESPLNQVSPLIVHRVPAFPGRILKIWFPRIQC